MVLAPETFDFLLQLTGGITAMGFILSLFLTVGDDTEFIFNKK